MKILFLSYKYPPVHLSGLELGTRYMARELKTRGHDVIVVVTRRDSGQSFLWEDQGVPVYRIPVLPIPFLRTLWELLATSFMILELRPKLIHGQALFPCGWLAGLWGKLLRCRSVVYLYGRDVVHKSRLLRDVFGKMTLAWCDRVLSATKHCEQHANDIAKIEGHVFYSGFDPDQPKSLSVARQSAQLAFVGRLDKVKGLDVLLKALKQVQEPWTLSVAGDGPEAKELQHEAAALGIGENIDWRGRLTNSAVHELLQESHALILPSREEPFGVVLLEALAAGCHVVASRVGGIPEIVTSEARGILFNSESVEELAAAVTRVLKSPPQNNQIQTEVTRAFRWSARVDELEIHYGL